ncbi:MAG: helix-turn-helix transcriptional regulator, partial [Candidatus Desulforudis sp.]|nr:helix-turn-helix transcriptional regulator [Desulforudis sp.]
MIGDRMRQARLSVGLTLEEVVERLGHIITKQGLSKYENNKSIPKPDFLARLGEVLGVKTAYFLYEPRVQIKW